MAQRRRDPRRAREGHYRLVNRDFSWLADSLRRRGGETGGSRPLNCRECCRVSALWRHAQTNRGPQVMTKRRDRGDGGIDKRGPDSWRLRYRIKGQRFSVTFKGTLQDARKKVRALLRSGDTGEHVAPDKVTLAAWIEQWLAAGAPGRQRKGVGRRSLVRYEELLRVHVLPMLGARPLQQIQATEIDRLYQQLETKIASRTAHQVHVVLGACLGTAVRKGLLSNNPMMRVERI